MPLMAQAIAVALGRCPHAGWLVVTRNAARRTLDRTYRFATTRRSSQ
jgi:hypothetical protein